MLFSSPDYPLFLIAVFFLYALARWGGPAMAWARLTVMVLLGDVVFLVIAKQPDALWDPIGGTLLRLVAAGGGPIDWGAAPVAQWFVGGALLGASIWLGRTRADWIATDRGQSWIARGLTLALAAVGATVLIAWRAAALDEVTRCLAAHGHLAVLFVLGVGLGAGQRAPHRALGRVVILFVASSLFYHAWAAAMPGPYRYLLALLLATITLDYYLGLWIERSTSQARRKALVIVSLCSNLGILVFFKYADFLTQDVLHLGVAPMHLILPAGISFHTFQSLSYTIDVYRGELRATRSVVQFATFVLFFPQLVAGPIVRAQDLLPQLGGLGSPQADSAAEWQRGVIDDLPALDREAATAGLFRIVVGLFKKIAIADTLALALVDRVFEAPERFSAIEVLFGVYAYALQIYLDFSAYSDIAIGSAQVLGFTLPENFRTPYRSANLQEFWRRWHISLSTWLRDYLYITLGGSRGAPWRTYVNLFATMVLGGLWHGASWAFIVWGALHGAGLAVTRYFQRAADPRRLVLRCAGFAVVALVLWRLLLSEAGTWAQLVAVWIAVTPLWAVATAWLSGEREDRSAPAVVAAPVTATKQSIKRGKRKPKKRAIAKARSAQLAPAVLTPASKHDGERYASLGGAKGFAPIVVAKRLPKPVAELRGGAAVLRYAMCIAGAGFLAALQWAPSWTWIPLIALTWLLGIAADAVARRGLGPVIALARRGLAVALVFQYVCLAWIFFRASSFDNALAVLRQIATLEADHANLVPMVTTALVAGFACHFFADGSFRWLGRRFAALPAWAQGAVLAAIALILRELGHTKIVPFIYFQF